MKESFILYTDQKQVIEKLTDEQAGKLIKAIYTYVETNTMPKLDGVLDLVIIPFKTAIDKNREKYERVSKVRAIAGAKGGKQKKQLLANASKCYDNDNEYEYDNESDITTTDNIYEFVEQNLGRPLSPVEYELINTWEDNDLTRYAIKQTALNRASSLKYTQAILNAYKAKGITSVIEAEKEAGKHNKKIMQVPNWFDKDIKQDMEYTKEEQAIYDYIK